MDSYASVVLNYLTNKYACAYQIFIAAGPPCQSCRDEVRNRSCVLMSETVRRDYRCWTVKLKLMSNGKTAARKEQVSSRSVSHCWSTCDGCRATEKPTSAGWEQPRCGHGGCLIGQSVAACRRIPVTSPNPAGTQGKCQREVYLYASV